MTGFEPCSHHTTIRIGSYHLAASRMETYAAERNLMYEYSIKVLTADANGGQKVIVTKVETLHSLLPPECTVRANCSPNAG